MKARSQIAVSQIVNMEAWPPRDLPTLLRNRVTTFVRPFCDLWVAASKQSPLQSWRLCGLYRPGLTNKFGGGFLTGRIDACQQHTHLLIR
jgi:hypothetical protein